MLRAASSPPRLSTLVLLTALSVLSLNMFLPSLSNIAEEFEADYALVNLSIAGYLGIMAVLQLIMGPLSDRYGRRPVLLAGTALFALASLGCALAGNIWVFLAFRILQGAIVAGNALSRAVIRDMVPAREAASLMAHVAMAMAVAPMLGPMLGGALDEIFGWRASFVVFTGLGVLVLGLCWIDLGETNRNPSETFIKQFHDYPELLRLAALLGLRALPHVLHRRLLRLSGRRAPGREDGVRPVPGHAGRLHGNDHRRLHVRQLPLRTLREALSADGAHGRGWRSRLYRALRGSAAPAVRLRARGGALRRHGVRRPRQRTDRAEQQRRRNVPCSRGSRAVPRGCRER